MYKSMMCWQISSAEKKKSNNPICSVCQFLHINIPTMTYFKLVTVKYPYKVIKYLTIGSYKSVIKPALAL